MCPGWGGGTKDNVGSGAVAKIKMPVTGPVPVRRRTWWRRVRRDRLTLLAGAVLALTVAMAVVVPIASPYPYDFQDLLGVFQMPSRGHPLGTDHYGRDLLTRLAFGGRISLTVGGMAVLVQVIVGLVVGAASGFFGGWVDHALMRVTDVVFAFPTLLFAILVTGILGASLLNIVLALSMAGWPAMARTVRAEILGLKEKEFVEAARGLGATSRRIIVRHLLPNVFYLVAVRASLDIGPIIIAEATLSFLGIGIQPPTPSWGVMIADAFQHIRTFPYLVLVPSAMLSVTILAFSFFGEGLAEALDPRFGRAR
ncbi:MAG: ABC transporter permease [Armatimonadetes bacterium]|nr:ABC transporter permease [Armatimonadota bacterium]